jgi:hypothetical protein
MHNAAYHTPPNGSFSDSTSTTLCWQPAVSQRPACRVPPAANARSCHHAHNSTPHQTTPSECRGRCPIAVPSSRCTASTTINRRQ